MSGIEKPRAPGETQAEAEILPPLREQDRAASCSNTSSTSRAKPGVVPPDVVTEVKKI
jgi:hypothetical protein